MLGVGDVEEPEAEPFGARPHPLRERQALGIRLVGAAGHCRDRVIEHAEGEIRTAHRAIRLLELRERVRAVQVVHEVAVHIDDIAPIGTDAGPMLVPDFGK